MKYEFKLSEFNRRVTLYTPTFTRSDEGDQITSLGTGTDVWAKVDYYRISEQNEREFEGNFKGIEGIDFYIRYRTGITTDSKVLYGGEYYDVEATSEIGNKLYLKIRTIRYI